MVQSYTRELCVIKISAQSDNVMGSYECEYHARYSLLFALLTSHPYIPLCIFDIQLLRINTIAVFHSTSQGSTELYSSLVIFNFLSGILLYTDKL